MTIEQLKLNHKINISHSWRDHLNYTFWYASHSKWIFILLSTIFLNVIVRLHRPLWKSFTSQCFSLLQYWIPHNHLACLFPVIIINDSFVGTNQLCRSLWISVNSHICSLRLCLGWPVIFWPTSPFMLFVWRIVREKLGPVFLFPSTHPTAWNYESTIKLLIRCKFEEKKGQGWAHLGVELI